MQFVRVASLPVLACCTLLIAACAHSTEGSATAMAPTTTGPRPPATTSISTRTPAPATTSTPPAAQAAEYAGTETGSYYFTSPSGKFECAVITAPTPVAGCHGTLPSSAPRVPAASGTGTTTPNSIRVTASGPGRFVESGDPAFHRFDTPATPLPYGSPLRVQGFTCSVDERAGVTCVSTAGNGFTVSDSAYRLW